MPVVEDLWRKVSSVGLGIVDIPMFGIAAYVMIPKVSKRLHPSGMYPLYSIYWKYRCIIHNHNTFI